MSITAVNTANVFKSNIFKRDIFKQNEIEKCPCGDKKVFKAAPIRELGADVFISKA